MAANSGSKVDITGKVVSVRVRDHLVRFATVESRSSRTSHLYSIVELRKVRVPIHKYARNMRSLSMIVRFVFHEHEHTCFANTCTASRRNNYLFMVHVEQISSGFLIETMDEQQPDHTSKQQPAEEKGLVRYQEPPGAHDQTTPMPGKVASVCFSPGRQSTARVEIMIIIIHDNNNVREHSKKLPNIV